MGRPVLVGYMALESWADDYSEFEGAITGPEDPTGANQFWERPIPMIEKSAYDKLYTAIRAVEDTVADKSTSAQARLAAVKFHVKRALCASTAEEKTK